LSGKVKTLLDGEGAIGRTRVKAEQTLQDRRELGDTITNLDLIDQTKRVLGDEIEVAIRTGEKSAARDLVRAKNVLIKEADVAIPEYGEARSVFAGKEELKKVGELGEQFFKLNRRELEDVTSSLGDSEQRMFKLGAKRAIEDRVDGIGSNRDAVKALFGKNGDVAKLRSTFDNDEAFDQFSKTLEREANFVLTRSAAQANSTTIKQATDAREARSALSDAGALLGDPIALSSKIGGILSGFSAKKGEAEFIKSLSDAGDILLQNGMDPVKLEGMLRRGVKDEIQAALESAIIKAKDSKVIAPSAVAAAGGLGSDSQQ